MGENVIQSNLIGYYHFTSKDKSREFYIVQTMVCKPDMDNMKSVVIPVFVTEDIYKCIVGKEFGSKLDLEIKPNLETGKINYKVLI